MILTEIKLKRAIQSCKNRIEHHYKHTNYKKSKAIENEYTKIKALKKQIPKKPIINKANLTDFQDFHCPYCNKKIISKLDGEWIAGRLQKYCENCGQALDWSDVV